MNSTALIIDDEELACDTMEWLLKKNCPQITRIIKCNDPLEAPPIIEEAKPGILFLDIEMPRMNGLEFLSKFKDPDFQVIFVTAHDKFAVKAFKFHAVDYLLKPIDSQELINAVERVMLNEERSTPNIGHVIKSIVALQRSPEVKRVALPTFNEISIIEIDRIVYCEGEGNYTNVVLNDGSKIVLSKTLKLLEDFLDDKVFFRIHNKYLVNLKYVSKITRGEGGFAVLNNGSELPISRYKRAEFLDLFSHL